MSKFALVFLVICVMTVWATALNCHSCGAECVPACGTRYFRTCCFNYLRRKRGYQNENMGLHTLNLPSLQDASQNYDFWTQDPFQTYYEA